MFQQIKNWLQKTKENAAEKERVRGYCYAAGQLLKMPNEDMELRLLSEADCPFTKTDFDRGIGDAVFDFQRQKHTPCLLNPNASP